MENPATCAATLPTLKATPLLNLAAPVLAWMATLVDTALLAAVRSTLVARTPRLAAVITPACACVTAAEDCRRTVPVPALMAWLTTMAPPALRVMSLSTFLMPVTAAK